MENKEFKFEITEEMVVNATSYIPLAKKIGAAKTYAPECIEEVEISLQKLQADTLLTLPPLCKENDLIEQLRLLNMFLTLYLHIEVEEPFTPEAYDKYASSHPINQLERFKANPALKSKVFDILADYRELKNYFQREIVALIKIRNDGWERTLTGISVMSSPEALKAMVEEIQKISEPLEQLKATAKQGKGKGSKSKTAVANKADGGADTK